MDNRIIIRPKEIASFIITTSPLQQHIGLKPPSTSLTNSNQGDNSLSSADVVGIEEENELLMNGSDVQRTIPVTDTLVSNDSYVNPLVQRPSYHINNDINKLSIDEADINDFVDTKNSILHNVQVKQAIEEENHDINGKTGEIVTTNSPSVIWLKPGEISKNKHRRRKHFVIFIGWSFLFVFGGYYTYKKVYIPKMKAYKRVNKYSS